MARITLAGEDLIAQKQGAQQTLDIARFVFANVPGLDPTAEVDRAAAKPPANQIVYTAPIPAENKGYVNPSQVVYSISVGSDVGDWDFNWVGLESAEGVLFAVSYVPLQQKRRNIPPIQVGNNVTRNFLVAFDGAQELTGITIDASTWQHDFTVRLVGIDRRERQSNRDLYGRAMFFGSALQLEKVGSTYQVKPGIAYVEGIRIEVTAAVQVAPPALPASAWLDVALVRSGSDVVASYSVVWGADLVDYVDAVGAQHYRVRLADLPDSNTVTDRRPAEPLSAPVLSQIALRNGDYADLRARSTTKEDVGLGNLPNAKSDDPETDSSDVLATTKALKTAQRDVVSPTVGQVASFAMTTAPAGWLKCNGAAISRTTFADLFAKIGTTFGAGDGSTTFNLPDLRGEFLRGWDDGRGVDTARAFGGRQDHLLASHAHTASTGAAGSHSHSVSGTALNSGSHYHHSGRAWGANENAPAYGSSTIPARNVAGAAGGSSTNAANTSTAGDHSHSITGTAAAVGDHAHTVTVNATGGTETRPRNVAILFCIRY